MNQIKQEFLRKKDNYLLIMFIGFIYLTIKNIENIFGFLAKINDLLAPLYLGIIIAFIINIIMINVEKMFIKLKPNNLLYKKRQSLSLIIAVLISILFFALLIVFVIPEFINSLNYILKNIQVLFSRFIDSINDLLKNFSLEPIDFDNSDSLRNILDDLSFDIKEIVTHLSNFALSSGNSFINIITSISNSIINFTISIVIAMFLLLEKKQFIKRLKKLLLGIFGKVRYYKIMKELKDANEILHDFVAGKLLECVIVCVMVALPLALLNIPYALLCGVLCGVVSIVPIFGSIISTIICVILLITVNPLDALIFFIIYQIVLFLDGNVIYPKFISKSLGLSPVFILLGIIVGGGLYGLFGFIIAVPLMSYLYNFIARIINNRIKNDIENID